MAQVDFSNAVLDVNTGYYPLRMQSYISLGANRILVNSTGTPITQNSAMSVVENTPSKVSILYTGSFDTSGTEFYLHDGDTAHRYWKVSGISFSSGDTYSFIIDIETSGNT